MSNNTRAGMHGIVVGNPIIPATILECLEAGHTFMMVEDLVGLIEKRGNTDT